MQLFFPAKGTLLVGAMPKRLFHKFATCTLHKHFTNKISQNTHHKHYAYAEFMQ